MILRFANIILNICSFCLVFGSKEELVADLTSSLGNTIIVKLLLSSQNKVNNHGCLYLLYVYQHKSS